jgi:hypothetical protein
MAMAARRPMTTMTIMSSRRVKPRSPERDFPGVVEWGWLR